MAQTEEEKQAAADAAERAKVQAETEVKIADLTEKLEAAEKRSAAADAKVADLEGQIAGLQAAAPAPVAQRGTITVDATGKVQ